MTGQPFPIGHDPAFLFGCGRFRMEAHLLENCVEEIVRFGRHPLLVCDDNSQRDAAVGRRFTHGELVAVGLVMQHVYNGRPDEADALAARLRGWGLSASVAELGLPTGPEEEQTCLNYIMGTKTMKAVCEVDNRAEARLGEALKAIFR